MTESPAATAPAKSAARSIARPPVAGAVATGLCALFGMAGLALRSSGLAGSEGWAIAAWAAAYAAGGMGPTRHAAASLRQGELNVDVLMIVAALGAAAIGDWVEGVVLLFLFSLSGVLEDLATYRTTRSIDALVQLRPSEAVRVSLETRQEERVAVESLAVGDMVRVRPGERFAVDGVVAEGETWADESTLTGESQPVAKGPGAQVFAGTMNGSGSVLVRMTKAVGDTTLQRIIHLVQEAQSQKTPTQRFVESWQQPYVIGVLAASAAMFFAVRLLHAEGWYDAFYHAMV
ncbi:MAG: heavy metal translocating P-type ATPase, partial [Pirellulales bacterium]|nr:heavy metal translocating P-type ATPase [Pirellulales bacterium]